MHFLRDTPRRKSSSGAQRGGGAGEHPPDGQRYGDQIRRVFLADGDALVLPTRRLLSILEAIRIHMPAVRRISSYCLPRNLRKKSQADIDELVPLA